MKILNKFAMAIDGSTLLWGQIQKAPSVSQSEFDKFRSSCLAAMFGFSKYTYLAVLTLLTIENSSNSEFKLFKVGLQT